MASGTSRAEVRAVELLLTDWHEAFYPVDLLLLHATPAYYGFGVPPGDGSGVVLIPGFLQGDMYLFVLWAWLKRIGYKPYFSGIRFNADCPNILIHNELNEAIDRARRETKRRVHLIGHSLGGIIGRSIAVQRPDDVASLLTLGTPFQGAAVHRKILEDAELVRRYVLQKNGRRVRPACYTAECTCPFMESLRWALPDSVRYTAIYTRSDGSVDWRACRTGMRDVDVEVPGTHAGLAFNPSVYRVVGDRLAVQHK